jgi:hypothetical protein
VATAVKTFTMSDNVRNRTTCYVIITKISANTPWTLSLPKIVIATVSKVKAHVHLGTVILKLDIFTIVLNMHFQVVLLVQLSPTSEA